MQNTSSMFTLIDPFLCLPLPAPVLLLPSLIFFWKMYIDGPDGWRKFCLGTSNLYISCFNQTNPSLLTLSLSPCSPIFNSLWYIMLYYIHI
jgi:hypothetical protein